MLKEAKMLKEARIVIPMPFDTINNLTLNDVFQKMEWDIARNFGGFTVLTGESSRRAAERLVKDTVKVYDIAMEAVSSDAIDKAITLKTIACRAAYRLQQAMVYIRYANGSVEVVDIAPWAAEHLGDDSMSKPVAPVDNGDEEVKPVVIETDRKPMPGQIWETRSGSIAAVLFKTGDCLKCVILRAGPPDQSVGERFTTTSEGRRFSDFHDHWLDLRRFTATF